MDWIKNRCEFRLPAASVRFGVQQLSLIHIYVARRTGLSLSTISKYLNGGNVREANRLAIDAAVAELGFSVNVFARSLTANRSKMCIRERINRP